jgi:hypothetical protein
MTGSEIGYHAAAAAISSELERHTEQILQACKDSGVEVLGVNLRHNGRSVIAQNGTIVGGVDVTFDAEGRAITVSPSFHASIADAYMRARGMKRIGD